MRIPKFALSARSLLAVLGTVILLAVALLWFERRSIADSAIADALKRAGVPARYRVAEIGLRWQRIERISLGDPAAPDLTADWAEVRFDTNWTGVHPTAIRAGNVRLRGKLVDGHVSWGALDRLLPKPSAAPFALPPLTVDVGDVRIGVETPWGLVGARVDGRGRLDDGFGGKIAVFAPRLATGACDARRVTAYLDLKVRRGAPSVKGPVRIGGARCAGVALAASSIGVDAQLTRNFDAWHGTAQLDMGPSIMAVGSVTPLRGQVAFSGTAHANTGKARLTIERGRLRAAQFAGGIIDGAFGQSGGNVDVAAQVHVDRIVPASGSMISADGLSNALRATPLGPLVAQLQRAIDGAAQGVSLDAAVAAIGRPAGASATITRLTARTRSGAVVRLGGGSGVRFGALGLVADAHIDVSGGGFPVIQSDFRRFANGETRGIARIAPLAADTAKLAITPVAFRMQDSGGWRLSTVAALDGPLPDGRIEGFRVPIVVAQDPRGTIVANPGCTPLTVTSMRYATLRIEAARLELCPVDRALFVVANGRVLGGATVVAPRLTGKLGETPLDLSARLMRIGLGDRRFALADAAVRLGRADRLTRLDLGTLDGHLDRSGVSGRFSRLGGQIAAVPLRADGGAGLWQFARGGLSITGAANVADTASPERFRTINANDIRLTLRDGRIAMTGKLREPVSGITIASLDLRHELARGTGHATLDVDGLNFDKMLQPDAITPLTIGVIANVRGRVAGRGHIAWTADGVTSSGRFGTQNIDFAAAFGPVAGVRGDIVFTDLLGLVTAPGQTATIASVNPGVAVLGGRVRYRLAAGQRIVVEDGRWPFAGGTLLLEPTVLDMGQSEQRRLTFRVDALDAARFIEMLQFEDLAATGTFDGTIPMIFDAQGGRIEGGEIRARAGGGTIAYVGDVSNARLNVYAKLAFDALKSLKYQNLRIGLRGPLDGEMVSTVDFRGINQNPVVQPKNFIVRKFIGLPFKFNVVIRAPFRSLLYTARTFQDPSLLIRGIPLPTPIQPPASEKRP